MTEFTWHTDPVPASTPIRQVYGFCFDTCGRLLIRIDGAEHSLPGGRPEPDDADIAATLARECLEEVQVTINEPVYLGYQRVDDRDGHPPYAQVRMVALVTEIRPAHPDTDTGRTYRRLLTTPTEAGDLLAWGEPGRQQAAAAAALAADRLGVPTAPPADAYV